MEFILESATGGSRLGKLNFDGLSFTTPNFMLNTKSGSVPYVSIDILEKLKIDLTFIQMPVDSLINCKDVIKQYNKGIHNFTALQGSSIYCCIHDYTVLTAQGFNDVKGVALWGKSGKIKVDADSYMDFIDSLQPTLFQALADTSTDEISSKKRVRKSVDRSIDYLDQCISRLKDSKKLNGLKIIGTIVGGYDAKERLRCATEVNKRDVFGYSFDGFDTYGQDISKSKCNSIFNLISSTLPNLNKTKFRIFSGILNPYQVILAVKSGIDIFDSSYVYAMTEKRCALTFDLDYGCHKKETNNIKEFIDLADKKFSEDHSRLASNCGCYCCENYTRSYLHHLVATRELLAPILLFVHNLHQFQDFFDQLKLAIQKDELDIFEEHLVDCEDTKR